jgi:3-oxoacyl-[acyl-carrier protein] reductase
MRLENKVSIVTGAGGGIGRAIASAFLEHGARVAAVDIEQKALMSLESNLPQPTEKLLLKVVDATVKSNIFDIVQETLGKWGRIDILVNNVGGSIGIDDGIALADEDWDKTIILNLTGNFILSQSVIDSMKKQKTGRIVNISSSGGRYRSNTGAANIAYAAAKGGVLQLTRTAAHALGRFGITVNSIAPGSVLTEAGKKEYDSLAPEIRERVLRETPLGYFAQPREIANIAVFLASDAASYITGATILANGGWCTS